VIGYALYLQKEYHCVLDRELSALLDYRLYCQDADRLVARAEWIQAKSDDEAIAFARAEKLGVDCELWQGNRLVAQVAPYPSRHTPTLQRRQRH